MRTHRILGRVVSAAACVAALASAAWAEPASEPYAWKNVQIVGGGFVSGIVTHPTEPGLIYCRTDIGGAYRWDAEAKRWIPLTDWIGAADWNYTGIESLAVDPSNPDRVYIAAGTYTNFWAPTNGAIFRSDDRGATWAVKAELPFKFGGNEDGRNNGERLAVDPNDPDVVFFGSRPAGLWRSTDAGQTWSEVTSFPEVAKSDAMMSTEGEWARPVGIPVVLFDPRSGGGGEGSRTIYAAVSVKDTSLFRSTDGGETWGAVPGQPTGLRPNHAVIDAAGVLYVTYGDAPGPNGMTDGAVWKLDTNTGEWIEITPVDPNPNDRHGYCGVSIDPRRPGTLVVSTMDRWAHKDNIFRSTDGGETWHGLLDGAAYDHSNAPYTKTSTPHWTGDVEINPFDSDHVLFVTGYGIWATRNATAAERDEPVRWSFESTGIEECVVNQVISPPEGAPLFCVMWDLDGFRHERLDASPSAGRFEPHYGRNVGIDFAQQAPDFLVRIYGGRNNTHGSYSTDNGVTWTAFASAPAGNGDGTVAVAADGSSIVWTPSGSSPHVSRDRGAMWERSAGATDGVRVVSDRVDAARFYGYHKDTGDVYVSTDGGASFDRRAAAIPAGDASLGTPFDRAGEVWAASQHGLFRSTDSGASFAKLGGVEKASRVAFGKAADSGAYPAVFIVGHIDGTYGFYRSDDAGATWVRVNDDEHQFGSINSIAGDPRVFGRLYIASANRGVLYGDPAPVND